MHLSITLQQKSMMTTSDPLRIECPSVESEQHQQRGSEQQRLLQTAFDNNGHVGHVAEQQYAKSIASRGIKARILLDQGYCQQGTKQLLLLLDQQTASKNKHVGHGHGNHNHLVARHGHDNYHHPSYNQGGISFSCYRLNIFEFIVVTFVCGMVVGVAFAGESSISRALITARQFRCGNKHSL